MARTKRESDRKEKMKSGRIVGVAETSKLLAERRRLEQ